MKRNIKITAFVFTIIFAACTFFACSSPAKSAEQIPSPEVQRERFSMLAQNRVVEETPGITKTTTLETEGDALISADCPQVEGNEAISASLSAYVQEKLMHFKSETADMGEAAKTERLHFFTLTYKPYVISSALLGIKFTESSYTGKTDISSHIDSFVYHLSSGERLGLEDVFDNGQDYLPIVAGKAREYLSRSALLQDKNEQLFEDGTSPTMQNYSNFAITPDHKIIFYFNQGSIAPLDVGSLEVSIPLSELEGYLNQQNRDMLYGTGAAGAFGADENAQNPDDPEAGDIPTVEGPQEVLDLFPSGDNYMLPHTLDGIDINGKVVALTMDDGPSKNTAEVLDILKEEDVKATFFIIGENISGREDLVQREYDEGHELGTHTWDHKYLSEIPFDDAVATISKTNDAIEEIIGKRTILDRPPGGYMNADLAKQLERPQIMWNVDTLDWKYNRDLSLGEAVPAAVEKAMSEMRDGSVVLWHDLHQTAPGILRALIKELKAQDYQFVTSSQMMQIAKLRGAGVGRYFSSAPTAEEAAANNSDNDDDSETGENGDSSNTGSGNSGNSSGNSGNSSGDNGNNGEDSAGDNSEDPEEPATEESAEE